MTAVQPLSLAQTVEANSRLQPEKTAARDLQKQLTYRQLNARSNSLANALFGLGLAAGDRVAVLAYNRMEWAEIYIAAGKSGLVVVPINFRLTATETKFIIEHSGASALIVEDQLLPLVEEVREQTEIPPGRFILMSASDHEGVNTNGYRGYEKLIGAARDTTDIKPPQLSAPWCIMYTSGTTGRPKGAIRTHYDMSMLAMMTAIELKLHRRDDALLVMPMCHANSLNFFTSFLYSGGTVTIFSKANFDPGLCLRTFASTGATFSSLVPTHYTMMLDAQSRESARGDYHRVEKLMISSAPARPDTKQAVMEMFPNSGFFELYGSTEAGWVTMLHPHEQFEKLGTVGREVVGSQPILLIDEQGNEVSDGSPGELYSCAPYCFAGYWQQPDATASAFRGSYLSVGDIALRDEDGFIKLIDRKKNIIISGGENIYPSEVEAVVGAHCEVSDVAVVGQADELWGERVTAAVVLHSGSTLDEQQLIEWSRSRLAGYKRPREVLFLDAAEMPRNTTGKILHRELRELVASRVETVSGSED